MDKFGNNLEGNTSSTYQYVSLFFIQHPELIISVSTALIQVAYCFQANNLRSFHRPLNIVGFYDGKWQQACVLYDSLIKIILSTEAFKLLKV